MTFNNITKNINLNEFKELINKVKENKYTIFLRFTADWCVPCKSIDADCNKVLELLSDNIFYLEIDIDETMELYAFFKKNKLLKGIPALYIYSYNNANNDEKWYLPEYSINSANKEELNKFFGYLSKYIQQ